MERRIYSLDGNYQRLDGGAMFGNAPRALWESWAAPDARHRIELASRALLVDDGGGRILFEAGAGFFMSPTLRDRYGIQGEGNQLLKSLQAIGLTDSDIQVVVLSHLHFDHAGGLLSDWQEDQPQRLLFPQARFLVSRQAWYRATHPHSRDRASFVPVLNELLKKSGRLEIIDGPAAPCLGDGYTFHFSHGHTPGLMLCEIQGEHSPVLFISDLAPGRAWVHTSITMGYDRFPELLIDEKRRLLDHMLAQHGRLFFTHDPTCALAHVTRDERLRYGTTNPRALLQDLAI